MSNLDSRPESVGEAAAGVAVVDPGPVWSILEGREVVLGGTRAMGTDGLAVWRTLPNRDRRMVGAWCFLDAFGPSSCGAMRVPPHPHTGLQTVTWLLAGTVRHQDSLGSDRLIAPGQLNLMTAGRAVAHAETSQDTGPLHGCQLWVALPAASRNVPAAFEHHADLPVLSTAGGTITVLMGELDGAISAARAYTPLIAADATIDGDLTVALDPSFEHAVLALSGEPEIEGRALRLGPLAYLGRGRDALRLSGAGRVLLLGGEPFDEEIVMWWNFVGRSHDDIVADREDWMAGRRFRPVASFDGEALRAPALPTTRLVPRGRVR